jgi:hypothetical protein
VTPPVFCKRVRKSLQGNELRFALVCKSARRVRKLLIAKSRGIALLDQIGEQIGEQIGVFLRARTTSDDEEVGTQGGRTNNRN